MEGIVSWFITFVVPKSCFSLEVSRYGPTFFFLFKNRCTKCYVVCLTFIYIVEFGIDTLFGINVKVSIILSLCIFGIYHFTNL